MVILGATAAGIGAERRLGRGRPAATRRVLDVMLYGGLPLVTFFILARLELTAGVGAGLAFGYVARWSPARSRGSSASACCAWRARAPGRS